MILDPEEIYKKVKHGPTKYIEELHCVLILKVMLKEGRYSAFCKQALICEKTLNNWVHDHPEFGQCYALGKIYAREAWEQEGYELRDAFTPMGQINHAFEHWKMMGWSRFGVSKNGRVRLNLVPEDSPNKHYVQLIRQAAEGEFTASEFKQYMEAINIGLNVHQNFKLQEEINQLKSDLATMQANTDAHNSGTNQRIAQKD